MSTLFILLKNGKTINLPNISEKDFKNLCDTMRTMKNFFIWEDKVWVRKSEIACFGFSTEEVKEESSTPSKTQCEAV